MPVPVEVIVGVIGRPHGVRGEVTVEPRTDVPEVRFAAGSALRGERSGATFTVAALRRNNGRLLVSFDELTDRTTAEAARGIVLVADVPEDERPDEDDTFYDRQLRGLRVLDAAGAERGRVLRVTHHPAQDLLEIDTGTGIRQVPFVSALVPSVDLAAGTITLGELPGLLDDLAEDEPE